MEWREAAEEAFNRSDIAVLDILLKEMRAQGKTLEQSLTNMLDQQQAWEQAAGVVRKLSFIDKIRSDVEYKISKLEDE